MNESLKDKLMRWLWRHAERRPYFDIEDYMCRWWLLGGSYQDERTDYERGWRRGWLDRLIGRMVRARLHWTLRSDSDRHLHDHPSWSISIVLWGGYWEITPLDQGQHPGMDMDHLLAEWRGPGAIVFRRATSRHRLELPEGQTSLSIFIRGRSCNDWGFYTPDGKVYWKDYLGEA